MVETRIETYIPLYRKYRPQTFADLVGQEAVAQTLGNAIRLNKVAHAYLFCGPRGTGKTSTARIFAKSLNCENGPTIAPCLQCASCTGIANGNALDVIEFDAASNNGVDDARELIESCQYSSMSGRFKVYIIDEVHMLTPQAFNALLKTLEEPPANVIFIFATTEAHKVLPTIISRCQRFDFTRITTDNIKARLRHIAAQEQIAIDEEALLTIARHARGGLRDAVGLLDQVSVLSRAQQDKRINRKDVALFIGTLEEDLLLRLGRAIAERHAAELLTDLSELLSRGIEPVQLLKDLAGHFRNLLLVQASGAQATAEQLGFSEDYYRCLVEQAKLFPALEEIPQIMGRLSACERDVRHSNQPQLWLEVGLVELTYRTDIYLVKELAERVAQLEARLVGGVSITTASPASVPVTRAKPEPLRDVMPKPVQMPTKPATPASVNVPIVTNASGLTTVARSDVPANSNALNYYMSETPKVFEPTAVAPSGAPASMSLEDDFAQICSAVPSLLTRNLLQQQAFAISLENDWLRVGCTTEHTLEKVREKLVHVQKAAEKVYGSPVQVELVLQKQKPTESKAVEKKLSEAPPVTLPEATLPIFQAAAATQLEPDAPLFPEAPVDWMPDVPSNLTEEPAEEDEDDADEDETVIEASSVGAFIPPEKEIPAMAMVGADPALDEAKQHAVQLLQGKILD